VVPLFSKRIYKAQAYEVLVGLPLLPNLLCTPIWNEVYPARRYCLWVRKTGVCMCAQRSTV